MKCDWKGCEQPATYGMKILLFAYKNGPAAQAYLSVAVCGNHILSEEEFRTSLDDNWDNLVENFAKRGFQKPRKELVEFATCPVDEMLTWFAKFKASVSAVRN